MWGRVVEAAAVIACVAQIAALYLQWRQTRNTPAISGHASLVWTQIIQVHFSAATDSSPGRRKDVRRRSDATDDEIWGELFAYIAVGIVIALVYLKYRVQILASLAIFFVVGASCSLAQLTYLRRHLVIAGREWSSLFAGTLVLLGLGAALITLLLRDAAPFGSYREAEQVFAAEGWGGLTAKYEEIQLVTFALYQFIASLVLAAVVAAWVVSIGALISVINSVARQRQPNWFGRTFCPRGELWHWRLPTVLTCVLLVALLLASPQFSRWVERWSDRELVPNTTTTTTVP